MAMKKPTSFTIVSRYSRLSGDQKIRLGMSLSEAARHLREDGIRAMQKPHGKQHSSTTT